MIISNARCAIFFRHTFFIVFAIFLLAGNFKGDPRFSKLGADLTLLSAVILMLFTIYYLFLNGNSGGGSRILYMALFLGLIIPGILHRPETPYGFEKALHLSTLTLLAFMAGMEAGCLPKAINSFIFWKWIFHTVILAESMQQLMLSQGVQVRLTAFGGNTIMLGRSAGFVFLVGGILYIQKKSQLIQRLFGLILALLSAFVAIMSGSKGPIIAAAISFFVFCGLGEVLKLIQRLIVLGGLLICCMILAWSVVPEDSVNRMINFSQGRYGSSTEQRIEANRKGLELAGQHPLGIGWGGFNKYIPEWTGERRQYVHNLILEIFLEGGWIAGIVFLCAIYIAWHKARRNLFFPEHRIWLTFGLYSLLNAMVSGDVNDNRILFVYLGLALGIGTARDGLNRSSVVSIHPGTKNRD